MKRLPAEKEAAIRSGAKLIRTSGLMLLLSFSLLMFSVSYAWFSANRAADSSGMSMSASSTANLAITNVRASVPTLSLDDAFAVQWSAESGREEMLPATRDAGVAGTFLKYVTNTEDVDPQTGLAKGGKTLAYANVPTAANSLYYVDFTVYLTSVGAPLSVSSLDATLTAPEMNASTPKTHCAASIDFYIGSVAAANYKGTLNVAGKNPSSGAAQTSVHLLGTSTLAANTDNTPVTVIMRCYFDGSLLESAGTAYINTATVNTDELLLDVHFAATEAAT